MSRNKDYYSILGVEKNANDEDIKRAFRKLAKELHPDHGGDAEGFKAINEAYETLSDVSKRRHYDARLNGRGMYGNGIFHYDFQMPMDDWASGTWSMNEFNRIPVKFPPNILISISVRLGQAYVGFKTTVKYEKNILCTKCLGSGRISSRKSNERCNACMGTGKNSERAEVIVTVPPRTRNMTQIFVSGAGNIMKNGEKGDLHVQVTYPPQDDDVSMRHDGTLVKDMHVPWEDTLLGEKYSFSVVSNSNNDVIELKLNPAAPNGCVYKLRGLGMGKDADLLVKVWHLLPTKINEEDRKVIAEALKQGIQNAQSNTVQ
jgi:molecular chaperone DnaJ